MSDLLLVSVVAAVWIEHIGKLTGPALVHGGERERAASALKEAAADLAGVAGIGHVERRLEASSSPARGPHDTAMSEQADVIVVGSTHHGPLRRVLLGSVGERLLSGAPCAVAVAQRGYAARGRRPIGKIAVAFDGSPESRIALRAAHDLATRAGASLRALMVIEPPAAMPGRFVPLQGLGQLVTIERGEALQRQELATRATPDSALDDLGDGAPLEQEVLVGADPAAAILDVPTPTSPCSCSARALTGRWGARWSAASRLRSSGTPDAQCSSRRAPASIPADGSAQSRSSLVSASAIRAHRCRRSSTRACSVPSGNRPSTPRRPEGIPVSSSIPPSTSRALHT